MYMIYIVNQPSPLAMQCMYVPVEADIPEDQRHKAEVWMLYCLQILE